MRSEVDSRAALVTNDGVGLEDLLAAQSGAVVAASVPAEQAEIEVGKIFLGTVLKVVEFGAFVELLPDVQENARPPPADSASASAIPSPARNRTTPAPAWAHAPA